MIFTYYLTYNGLTETLENEPVGWDAVEIRLERDRERHGIDENMDLSLQFHCQGAGRQVIEFALNAGIDEEIGLSIYLDCGGGNTLFYQGLLQLADVEMTDDFLTVPVKQIGVQQTFANRADTDININGLVGADGQALTALTMMPVNFEYHSRAIKLRAELETELNTIQWFEFTGATPPATAQPTGTTWTERIQTKIFIPRPTFTGFFPIPNFHQNGANLTLGSGNVLIQPVANLATNIFLEDGILEVEWNIEGVYHSITGATNEDRSTLSLVIYHGSDLATATVTVLGDTGTICAGCGNSPVPFSISGSTTINMQSTDLIWMDWIEQRQIFSGSVSGNSHSVGLEFSTFAISFEIDSEGEPSQGKAFPIYESTARVVEGICGAPIRSNFLGRTNSQPDNYSANGCGSFTVLANGYLIRNISGSDLFVNWNELFATLQSIFNVGWGWENGTVIIEDARDFYEDASSLVLDDINGITYRVASEFYTQRIEVGFNEWETNDLFISDETQTKRQYITRLKSVDNNIEAIAPFITSSYAIEVTRRLGGNDTYRDYNEKNFIIAATRDLIAGQPLLEKAEKNENFAAITGVRNVDTIYNYRFTPVKNLVRWFKTLNIGLTKYMSDLVRFASGEGNITAQSRDNIIDCDGGYNNQIVSESGNYDTFIGTVSESTPLFEPMFMEFEYPLTFSQYISIRNNRYKYIVANGEKAYIMQVVFRFNANSQILAVRKWE